MNELQILNFEEMKVRMVEKDDEVWFVAVDVAKALDIKNTTQAISRLDDDERAMFNIGRQGAANIISEAGLYSFIGSSHKQEARKFMRWVNHEVLPSIRKHGAYMTSQTIEQVLSDPDTIIKIATDLKNQRQQNAMLSQRINELEPKASYYDKILQNKALVNISVIAKDYGMSAVTMNKLLHDLGVQYKQGNMWLLYAQHQKKDWTKSNTTMLTKADGTEKAVMNTKWTQKGCLGLYSLLKENGYLPVIEQDDVEQPA